VAQQKLWQATETVELVISSLGKGNSLDHSDLPWLLERHPECKP
jgi:hypothetical protein